MRLFLLFLMMVASVSASPVTLEYYGAPETVSAGSRVEMYFRVTGLLDASAPSLGAFDITLLYDPSIVSFDNGAFGDPTHGNQLDLSGFGSMQFVETTSGAARLIELSFDSSDDLNLLQLDTFQLARFDFTVLTNGSLSFTPDSILLADAAGDNLEYTLVNTPEPGSFLLCATALLSLLALRRKRAA